jgi:hypothetical protein
VSSSKSQKAQSSKNKATLEKATSLDLEKTLASVNATSIQVNGLLGKVQEQLVIKHGELKAVAEAIDLKKQEMSNLHGADAILLEIDELNVRLEAHKQQVDQDLNALQAKFDFESKELDEQRHREQELYQYNLATRRKQEQDTFDEQVRIKKNAERDREEALTKSWKEREEALALKEAAYNDALAKNATFDAEVKTAVGREVAIVSSTLKREHEHANQIAAVQHKAEVSNLQKDVSALVAAVESLKSENVDLKTQLKEAQSANVTIASKALEGASNAKAIADAQSLITNIGGNGSRQART